MDDAQLHEVPLTIYHTQSHVSKKNSPEKKNCFSKVFSRGTCSEIKELLTLAWPTVLSNFFYHFVSMVSIFFAGRLGRVELAAGTLALSFMNITGLSLFMGFGSALDTLCAQAFGAKNFHLVGIILQRGIWILGLTSLFSCALWINTESLLLILHQPQNVARLAQEFVLICVPSLVGNYVFILLQKYLQAQGIVRPILYVGAASSVLHIGFNALFVLTFNLRLRGVAISWALSTTFMCLLLFTYMRVFKLHKETWPGWTMESLLNWGQFLRLAIPGMIMICIEWWSFEVGSFLSGNLGEVQLAVFGIIFQWLALIFMLTLGLSVAASVRVGCALGAGDPAGAKRTMKVAFQLLGCIESGIFAIMICLGDISGKVFSDNSEVIAVYKRMLPFVCSYFIFDGLQCVASGIVRGSGRQRVGMTINFVAFCCLGLPLGITLLFLVFNEVSGLLIGLLCGVALQTFLYIVLMWRTNWEQQAQLARKRTSAKLGMEMTPVNQLNGECSHIAANDGREIQDTVIASWIYKTSSLMLLNRMNSAHDQLCRSLLPDTTGTCSSHQEENGESPTCVVQGSLHRSSGKLSPSDKKSLVIQRLIPLFIALLIVGAAAAIRFLIPLPLSQELEKGSNGTAFDNRTQSGGNRTSYFNLS